MNTRFPSKIVVITVGMDLSGSDWGHDLTRGPEHILKNGGLEKMLKLRFHGRYEKYSVDATPSARQRKNQKIDHIDDILRVSKEVQVIAERSFNEGAFVILLGGEQTVDLGLVAGAATSNTHDGYQRILSISSIDGHFDCNTQKTSATKHIHGQTLASHCGYGEKSLVQFHGNGHPRVNGENVVIFGSNIRNKPFFTGQTTNYHDPVAMAQREQAYKREPANARRWGVHTIHSHEFDDRIMSPIGDVPQWRWKARNLLHPILQRSNGHIVLCDLDHLHEMDAPGVAMPNPEGLRLEQSLLLAEDISASAKGKLMGIAIVEADPSKDINNKTALAAARWVDVLTERMH